MLLFNAMDGSQRQDPKNKYSGKLAEICQNIFFSILPHSGSILDSQLGWEYGKFQLASCSGTIITELAAHPPSRQPNL